MGVARSDYPSKRGRRIVPGDPLEIPITVRRKDSDGVVTPYDVTSWTWRDPQVRSFVTSPTEVCHFTVVPGDDPTQGEIILQMASIDTVLLEEGMTFDLEALTPVHRTLWICEALHVEGNVSRPAP